MATAPTQPEPAEGPREDDKTGADGPQAPTQPQPAEGANGQPAAGRGSPG